MEDRTGVKETKIEKIESNHVRPRPVHVRNSFLRSCLSFYRLNLHIYKTISTYIFIDLIYFFSTSPLPPTLPPIPAFKNSRKPAPVTSWFSHCYTLVASGLTGAICYSRSFFLDWGKGGDPTGRRRRRRRRHWPPGLVGGAPQNKFLVCVCGERGGGSQLGLVSVAAWFSDVILTDSPDEI